MQKAVTVEQVISWRPCGLYGDDDGRNYTPGRIERLFAGRSILSAHDIVALNIPIEDRLWALLHPEFLTEEQMHLAACDFAEAVLPIFERDYPDDSRPHRAIESKRAWIRGEIGDDELAAARDAAWAAAWAAARDAAWVAGWDAAWAAARAAAWAAAWAAARAAAWAAARAAAWAAAWAAARDAAWDAGWDAARAAARAAARDAGWDAARDGQLITICRYIEQRDE